MRTEIMNTTPPISVVMYGKRKILVYSTSDKIISHWYPFLGFSEYSESPELAVGWMTPQLQGMVPRKVIPVMSRYQPFGFEIYPNWMISSLSFRHKQFCLIHITTSTVVFCVEGVYRVSARISKVASICSFEF